MKVSFLFPAFLAATQFLIADTGAPDPSASPAPNPADAALIARYDSNKDGKLDEAEVAAVKERMYSEADEQRAERRMRVRERVGDLRARFDADGDGKLNATEQAAFEQALRGRVEKLPRLRERLDTNGDGRVDDAEWSAGRERLLARLSGKNE